MSASPHPVPSGYEYVRRLGAGGFGEVFLARQVAVGRLVAIKRILPRALSDSDNVERFRREARVLAATDSPAVVRVFDLSTQDGNLYLVMEYVPGRTLTDLIAGGPLPAAEGLRILADVAEALREMASHGLVHRDVKPGNVLVLPDGHAKLADFGLARAVADTSAFRTAGGTPSGTPAYFAPEISLGTHEPDARSDGYSFAVMTYEVLTGRRPFDAPDALSMLMAHWEREPVPPQEALPGLPAEVCAALLAGLTKSPETRPLPHELVGRLAKIAPERWPAVARSPDPPPAATRHDPTIVSPGFVPPSLPSGSAAAAPRLRRSSLTTDGGPRRPLHDGGRRDRDRRTVVVAPVGVDGGPGRRLRRGDGHARTRPLPRGGVHLHRDHQHERSGGNPRRRLGATRRRDDPGPPGQRVERGGRGQHPAAVPLPGAPACVRDRDPACRWG